MASIEDDIKEVIEAITEISRTIKDIQAQYVASSFKRQRIRDLAQYRHELRKYKKSLEDAKR